MAQPDKHEGMTEAEGVTPPNMFENDEQRRTREISIHRHGHDCNCAEEEAIRNAPSTMEQNLLGAGADTRGTTDADRDEEALDLEAKRFSQGD